MPSRLGLDLGSNSIGWCLLSIDAEGDPISIKAMGTRLMTLNSEAGRDPQSGSSLAVNRRNARAQRRRRDRSLRRKQDLFSALVLFGLMPTERDAQKALERLDPYRLRAEGLDSELLPYELGRAIFHLHQRRGFRSNRRADRADDDTGAIKEGISALKEALKDQGIRTVGEFLWRRHQERLPVRARPETAVKTKQEGKPANKVSYQFYPDRQLTREEFDLLWEAQRAFHPELLNQEAYQHLVEIMFRQRLLRAPAVGKCSLFPHEERAAKAWPLFQRFRIMTEVANLRIARLGGRSRRLSVGEWQKAIAKLASVSSPVSFDKLRSLLELEEDEHFSIEGGRRSGLDIDQTAARLSNKTAFGKQWRDFSLSEQQAITERILSDPDEDSLISWLRDEFGLDEANAHNVSARISLPARHARFGKTARCEIINILQDHTVEVSDPDTGEVYEAPLTYDEAVAKLGLHHSDRRPTQQMSRLPYYGAVLQGHVVEDPDAPEGSQERIGRVTNPTVHIGLNQLRKLVNLIIDVYGAPDEIVLELGRELKLSADEKEKLKKEQGRNEEENDRRRARLRDEGLPDNGENRLRLRLYDEMPPEQRVCIYTGEPISIRRLFGSDIAIDHILPFSRTLDNSASNKVLCTRASNAQKGNRSPAEAWHGTEEWDGIVERVSLLPPNKRKRFAVDAMEKFASERGFLDRQLVDTQYLARIAKTYLSHVCDPDKVWVTPGRLTSMIRGKWGLNTILPDHNFSETNAPKNRKDHRHHAIDAFVIACTNRSLLNRISRAAGRAEQQEADRLLDDMPDPWEGFREELKTNVNAIIVSHRADHGTAGKLHEETAYGMVADPAAELGCNIVVRKPVASLTAKEIDHIRDPVIRAAIRGATSSVRGDKKALSAALQAFGAAQGIRRLRILKTEAEPVVIRHGGERQFEKAYVAGDNHRIEIYDLGDGKWRGEGISVFAANQPGFIPPWRTDNPEAALIMPLSKGDLVQLEHDGRTQIMRVFRLEPSNNRVRLAAHNQTGNLQERHDDPTDPFRWLIASYSSLQKMNTRRVRVDEIGRIFSVKGP